MFIIYFITVNVVNVALVVQLKNKILIY